MPSTLELERLHELIARHPRALGKEADDEQMPGMVVRIGGVGKRQERVDAGQLAAIEQRQLAPTAVQFIETSQLDQPKGGGDVREIGPEARFDDLGLRGTALGLAVEGIHAQSVELESSDAFSQGGVVGANHAAFARGEVFDGVEGEDGGALAADGPAPIARARGVGGVFDEGHSVFAGQLADGVQVDRGAGEVDGDNGLGARGEAGAERFGRDHERVAIDSGQNRRAPAMRIRLTVETQVMEGVTTSSPGPRPRAWRVTCMPPVWKPLPRPAGCRHRRRIHSRTRPLAAVVIQPERRTSATALISASVIAGRQKGRNSALEGLLGVVNTPPR